MFSTDNLFGLGLKRAGGGNSTSAGPSLGLQAVIPTPSAVAYASVRKRDDRGRLKREKQREREPAEAENEVDELEAEELRPRKSARLRGEKAPCELCLANLASYQMTLINCV